MRRGYQPTKTMTFNSKPPAPTNTPSEKGEKMRLIDADALLIKLKDEHVPFRADVNERIINAPTIDTVEVVRCKDCRRHKTYNCPFGEYDFPGNYMYCYYGERK